MTNIPESVIKQYQKKTLEAYNVLIKEGVTFIDDDGNIRRHPMLDVYYENSHALFELLIGMKLTPRSRDEELNK